LKNNYGQIYMIENTINNKKYIGQTTNEKVLHGRYRGNTLCESVKNTHLKNSIRKYGEENFKISQICVCDTKEELNEKEIYYINLYNTTNSIYGYNKHKGGLGGKQSDEVINRIRQSCVDHWKHNEEKRLSYSKRVSGCNNPIYKKGDHSEYTKNKISNTRRYKISIGEIDISNARRVSHSKDAEEKRTLSKAKLVYVQYNKNGDEINHWFSKRSMFLYLSEKGMTHYKTYGSFKLKISEKNIFNESGYFGYFYKIIKKEVYFNQGNTEVI